MTGYRRYSSSVELVDEPNATGLSFRSRYGHRLSLAAILVLALAVRLWRIDAQSIWYDEGWSIHLAQASLADALAQIASPGRTHPPGYYLLLMGWVRLWGSSVLAVRSLSAVLGTLTVWATYGLAWRVYRDRWVGLLAATMLALAPAHIVYAQETRMYALLALCAVLLWQLGYRRDDTSVAYGRRIRLWSFGRWVLFVAVAILGVYTHYFSVLCLLGLNLWTVIELGVRRGSSQPLARMELASWIGAQVAIAVAWMPWLAAAAGRVLEHQTQGASTLTVPAFFQETAAFLLGGHIALLGREPLYAHLVLVSFMALAIVSLWLLAQREERRTALFVLLQMLVPLIALLILMQLRPGYHPRYLLIVLPLMVVLLARGVVRLVRAGAWAGVAALALLAVWFVTAGMAAQALHRDPYYHRDDARATAALLQDVLSDDALVVVPTDDWALRYYLDERIAGIFLEVDREDVAQVKARIESALQGRSEAAFVRWHQGTSDHLNVLTHWIERFGVRIETHELSGYTVLRYALRDAPAIMAETHHAVRFGDLELLQAAVQAEASRDDALTVAITMRAISPLDEAYSVSLRLVDQAGRVMAQEDSLLLNQVGGVTSQWPVGEPVTIYHRLPLGPGLAPLSYTVDMGIYSEDNIEGLDILDQAGAPAGKRYELGTAQVNTEVLAAVSIRDVDRERFGLIALTEPVIMAEGFALAAHTPIADAYDVGQTIEVLLEWHHVGEAPLPDLNPTMQLIHDGVLLADASAAPVYDSYSTDQWQPGEIVLEWRAIQVPLEFEKGLGTEEPVILQLLVDEDRPLILGETVIESVRRVFPPPSPSRSATGRLGETVELVGYDLDVGAGMDDSPNIVLQAGQDMTVTLYWHVLATPEIDYTVFVQLLDENEVLIAQHDGPPAGGARPTSGWVAGEYVRDEHPLHWLDTDYRGPAVLQAGLYDPTTGARLMTPEGDSRIMLGDGTMVR
jgi:mannosyltransferase